MHPVIYILASESLGNMHPVIYILASEPNQLGHALLLLFRASEPVRSCIIRPVVATALTEAGMIINIPWWRAQSQYAELPVGFASCGETPSRLFLLPILYLHV